MTSRRKRRRRARRVSVRFSRWLRAVEAGAREPDLSEWQVRYVCEELLVLTLEGFVSETRRAWDALRANPTFTFTLMTSVTVERLFRTLLRNYDLERFPEETSADWLPPRLRETKLRFLARQKHPRFTLPLPLKAVDIYAMVERLTRANP